MKAIRRHLSWVAGGWLVCQLGLVPATSLALNLWAIASESHAECTCGHGDGAMCPMHHRALPRPGTCTLRGTPDADSNAFPLFWSHIVIEASTNTLSPFVTWEPTLTAVHFPIDWLMVPDPPPPRA
jgi:hypothetical protein